MYHIKQVNSLNGENEGTSNRVFARTKFLRVVSNYLSCCIWPVNKLSRAYESRKQNCSSLRRSFSAERKRVAAREND